MDFELIGALIRLRYKLLWANTRTRNGKIALFFAGYLLLVMVLALLGAGSTGAGMLAIWRAGQGATFAGAAAHPEIFHAGAARKHGPRGSALTTIFSETELRRFIPCAPSNAASRGHFMRHCRPVLDSASSCSGTRDRPRLYLFGVEQPPGSDLLAVLLLFVLTTTPRRARSSPSWRTGSPASEIQLHDHAWSW